MRQSGVLYVALKGEKIAKEKLQIDRMSYLFTNGRPRVSRHRWRPLFSKVSRRDLR
jgi:hypothetical protein